MSPRARRRGLRAATAAPFLLLLLLTHGVAAASPPPPDDPAGERPAVGVDDVIPERKPNGARPRIHKRDLGKLLDRELSIIETLESLQFGLAKKADELTRVQTEREEVERDLKAFEALFEREKEALGRHRERTRRRLRALSSLARTKLVFLVFSADGFVDLLRRERLLERLADDDRQRLVEYKEALAHFRSSEAELKRRRDKLAAVEFEIATAKAQIEQDHADHEELLRRVEEEREYYEKYHRELKRRSRQVARKIRELEGWSGLGWFEGHKGKLRPPINSAVVSEPYGYRVHSRFKTKTLHRGLTYRPGRVPRDNDGNPVGRLSVRSIYMGKVIYADWLSGYGNTVIIDHTKGFYTLYSRLDRITVTSGEVIKSRERIGFIGNGRTLRGAELYFELRRNGKPVDPAPWMR